MQSDNDAVGQVCRHDYVRIERGGHRQPNVPFTIQCAEERRHVAFVVVKPEERATTDGLINAIGCEHLLKYSRDLDDDGVVDAEEYLAALKY